MTAQAGEPAPGVPAGRMFPEAHRLRRPDDRTAPHCDPPPATLAATSGNNDARGPAAPWSDAPPQRALLRFGATPYSVRWLISVVAAVLKCAGWPDEVRDDVTLAVDEALQNAVEHGSAPTAPVEVELVLRRDAAEVTVRDRGLPDMAPPVASPSPPQDTSVRGRGRLIIASLADEAEWRPSGEGTEVRLRFRRDGER
jgi:anti-sigma regulatory factor (Ser/Thr protein kinase)